MEEEKKEQENRPIETPEERIRRAQESFFDGSLFREREDR